jgi:cephalosporin-C deacetylase-like acetyl esterase
MKIIKSSLVVFVVVVLGAIACGSAVCVRADTSVDLSGSWLAMTGDNSTWRDSDASEGGWRAVTLPGAPESAGFAWYRKHFTIPADWAGDANVKKYNRLYLHLGSLHGAAAIYLNGYEINDLGKLPKSGGGKFDAIAPSSDVTVVVPVSAQVSGSGSKTLLNWGADNVLAIRLYDSADGANPSDGALSIDEPTAAELFPIAIATDQTDHLFGGAKQVSFKVTFTNTTAASAPLTWSIDIVDDKGARLPGYTPQSNSTSLDPSSSVTYGSSFGLGPAGFFTFRVESNIDGADVPPVDFIAGWNADQIRSQQVPPDDLSSFWQVLRDDAGAGSLGIEVDKDASASAPGVSAYRISYTGLGGVSTPAWVAVPDSLPANPTVILRIPDYDADAVKPSIDLAKNGYVVVDMLATARDWTSGNAGQDYATAGIADPKTYVYRAIEANVLRVVRVLNSGRIPGVPARASLVTWGDGQGGALSLLTAALLGRQVAGAVAISPSFCDSGYTLERADPGSNPLAGYIASHPSDRIAVNRTLSYFDVFCVGPKIVSPVFFGLGLADKAAPAFAEFAAANAIGSRSTIDVEPAGHVPAASEAKALAWVREIGK